MFKFIPLTQQVLHNNNFEYPSQATDPINIKPNLKTQASNSLPTNSFLTNFSTPNSLPTDTFTVGSPKAAKLREQTLKATQKMSEFQKKISQILTDDPSNNADANNSSTDDEQNDSLSGENPEEDFSIEV
ncbi:MAG: hypothetical protein EKK61_04940 [Rickettsiales bacterium]|nr:MAG: hypothetical protein EKK61_04940 [Rickettsiales bacterium]